MRLRLCQPRGFVCTLGLVVATFGFQCFAAEPIPIPLEQTSFSTTFRFDARFLKAPVRSVNLCGEFNNWSHPDNPMTNGGDGIYSVTLNLAPGVWHYRFLVDDHNWFSDPDADKSLEETDDRKNSGIVVGVDARQFPAAQPNEIAAWSLAHDPYSDADCNVASAKMIRLRVRAAQIDSASVWCRMSGKWWVESLDPVDHDMGFARYGTILSVDSPRIEYVFEFTHGSGKSYLASGLLYDAAAEARAHPYVCEMQPAFETPEWARHVVWYQIFPERFRDGDPKNDPPGTQRWQSRWYGTLPGETAGNQRYYSPNIANRRYGGDLQGVREELPYLRQLGITAIYLNPIFESDSSHKYDTRDYRHVDDGFGVAGSAAELTGETDDPATWKWSRSDRVFLDLVQEAHRQGFKIIIDGVFNHVGKSNALFQDVLKHGRESEHAGWFEILDWGQGGQPGEPGGIQWVSWGGRNGGMPFLKKDPKTGLADGPRQYIQAIARRWLAPDGDPSRGVDGFRLDAADLVPHPFWVEFRNTVKSIKPDAYISGEIWRWSQPWLRGDQFDAVMNYQFAIPSQGFFADERKSLSPTEFDERLSRLVYNYPLQVAFVQMNLFDSHDTDRMASWFLNPDLGYNRGDRLQDPKCTYNIAKPSPVDFVRMRQAVDFQMSFLGAPMVYYGDEAGMWGPSDPSDRMPMWWADRQPFDDPDFKFDAEQFSAYQRAIAIHNQLPELQAGLFHREMIDDSQGVYAFWRDDGRERAYVVLNRSDRARRVELPIASASSGTEFVNWMDPREASVVPANTDRAQSRPTLRVKAFAPLDRVERGMLPVSLPAYGTAILTPMR
jgi:cyclomaltodextrinase / maltogenic alpha-amylase / neopullulanase